MQTSANTLMFEGRLDLLTEALASGEGVPRRCKFGADGSEASPCAMFQMTERERDRQYELLLLLLMLARMMVVRTVV
eukprot:1938349-Alexandrium_andersonii.AAC.1